jgi:hypothetical protein
VTTFDIRSSQKAIGSATMFSTASLDLESFKALKRGNDPTKRSAAVFSRLRF